MYLADSDVMIDYLTGKADAISLLGGVFPSGLAVSILTYAEVYQGIYRGNDPRVAERAFKRTLSRMGLLVISRTIARSAGRIRGDLKAQGQILPMVDVLIAASALHYDLALVTRNLRHFERIPSPKIYRNSSSTT